MFRTAAIGIALVSTWVVTAFLAASFWWNLWMYGGWIGTPRILHRVLPWTIDGEASYDATFLEMFVILGALFAVIFGIGLRRYRRMRVRA